MTRAILLAATVTLSACTASQVQTTLAAGQLYCQVRGETVAAQTTVGPILVPGALKSYVDKACQIAGGIAVSPPADGRAGVVTVVVPVAT